MNSNFPYELFDKCDCGCSLHYLKETPYSYSLDLHMWYGLRGVSFEEVFDSVPEEIQAQLLFHLDIFAKEQR